MESLITCSREQACRIGQITVDDLRRLSSQGRIVAVPYKFRDGHTELRYIRRQISEATRCDHD